MEAIDQMEGENTFFYYNNSFSESSFSEQAKNFALAVYCAILLPLAPPLFARNSVETSSHTISGTASVNADNKDYDPDMQIQNVIFNDLGVASVYVTEAVGDVETYMSPILFGGPELSERIFHTNAYDEKSYWPQEPRNGSDIFGHTAVISNRIMEEADAQNGIGIDPASYNEIATSAFGEGRDMANENSSDHDLLVRTATNVENIDKSVGDIQNKISSFVTKEDLGNFKNEVQNGLDKLASKESVTAMSKDVEQLKTSVANLPTKDYFDNFSKGIEIGQGNRAISENAQQSKRQNLSTILASFIGVVGAILGFVISHLWR